MSLFEDNQYEWRETFFVLFNSARRPTTKQVKLALTRLGPHYQATDLRSDADDFFESVTLISPDDYAAMDINCIVGEEIVEQGTDLMEKMKAASPDAEELKQINRLRGCDARFDIYHFEQVINVDEEEEPDVMDPGSLLIVLEGLTELCDGIGVDPQTETLV